MCYNIPANHVTGQKPVARQLKISYHLTSPVRHCLLRGWHYVTGCLAGLFIWGRDMPVPRVTFDDFIKRARRAHGDRYTYIESSFINTNKKMVIVCKKHGEFLQNVTKHLLGGGCVECARDKTRKPTRTTNDFIEKSDRVHQGKYDYSLTEYKGWDKPLKIICPDHGIFSQKASDHLEGDRCQKCARENRKRLVSLTTEEFIKRATLIHRGIYDYSLSIYHRSIDAVKIICQEHGVFEQVAGAHLRGDNCPACVIKQRTLTLDECLSRFSKAHGERYDYSKVAYKGYETKVTIICPLHKEFEQTPNHHIYGMGCPKCQQSGGEMRVAKFLDELGIHYDCQKKFNDCKAKNPLPFDFYFKLQERTFLIEVDGEQHFRPVPMWGGEEGFKMRVSRDQIKNNFAAAH
jgi:hypothetical protein